MPAHTNLYGAHGYGDEYANDDLQSDGLKHGDENTDAYGYLYTVNNGQFHPDAYGHLESDYYPFTDGDIDEN